MYVIAAICRDMRVITHIDVVEERNQEAIQNFVDELPVSLHYCTDGFKNYQEVWWAEDSEHQISIGKEKTHTIESLNANLRTYLGCLKRRSRCFSRSIEALKRALRLFAWFYNKRQKRIDSNPKLYKNRLPLFC